MELSIWEHLKGAKRDACSDYHIKFRSTITRTLVEKRDYSELSLPFIILLLSCKQQSLIKHCQFNWLHYWGNIDLSTQPRTGYVLHIGKNILLHCVEDPFPHLCGWQRGFGVCACMHVYKTGEKRRKKEEDNKYQHSSHLIQWISAFMQHFRLKY